MLVFLEHLHNKGVYHKFTLYHPKMEKNHYNNVVWGGNRAFFHGPPSWAAPFRGPPRHLATMQEQIAYVYVKEGWMFVLIKADSSKRLSLWSPNPKQLFSIDSSNFLQKLTNQCPSHPIIGCPHSCAIFTQQALLILIHGLRAEGWYVITSCSPAREGVEGCKKRVNQRGWLPDLGAMEESSYVVTWLAQAYSC